MAAPTASASTLKPNAGGAREFYLTKDERRRIAYELDAYKRGGVLLSEIIDNIEAIVNEGWQTCDCELTSNQD